MAFTTPIAELVERNPNGLLGKHPSWERVRLGDVATVQNGAAFKSEYFNTEGRGMPLLRIRDIVPGTAETWYDGPYEDEYIVEPGDLVIGMDGDFNHALWSGPPALLNQRVCRLVFRHEAVRKRYVLHVLGGYLAAVNDATPSVTVKHLSSKTVGALLIPLPSPADQDTLVDALDRLLTSVEQGRRSLGLALARLDAYRASTVRTVLTGRMRGFNDSVARELAAAPRLPLEDLGDIRYGYTTKASDEPLGPRFLRITDIQDGRVDWDRVPFCATPPDDLDAFRLRSGDIVFARLGFTTGKSYLIGDDVPESAVAASYLIRVRLDSRVMPEFVALFFQGAEYWEYVYAQRRGIDRPALNGSILGKLPVPVPSVAAQQAAVQEATRHLDAVEAYADALRRNLTDSETLQHGLMHAAVEGRLAPITDDGTAARELLADILTGVDSERASARDGRKKSPAVPVGS